MHTLDSSVVFFPRIGSTARRTTQYGESIKCPVFLYLRSNQKILNINHWKFTLNTPLTAIENC